MNLKIVSVSTKSDIKNFIDFQHELYSGDENYVPEIYLAQKELFDRKKYPFYEYGDVQSFLAYDDDKIVGRISAIRNDRYNEHHKSNFGFFGFFDFIDSVEVAQALFDATKKWLAPNNYESIMGPTNFTTNEISGYLIDGFDSPPMIMMPYNKPYYLEILQQLGLKKEMDMYAYMIYTEKAAEKSIRLYNVLESRLEKQGIKVRNVNLKDFKNEVERLKKVYNLAWDDNWGFVPFTDAEFDYMADGLKMLADEKFCYIAEANGEPVGFSISLPNANEITRTFNKGRLLPFNIIKLLLRKKKTKHVRIAATGIIQAYRRKGIEAIFFAKNILEARKRNLVGGEASWILESNEEMMAAAEKLNGELYKTYRLYSSKL